MHAAMRGKEMQMWRLIGVVARCSCAAVPQSRPFQQLEAGMTAGRFVGSASRNVMLHLLAVDGINQRTKE